MLNFYHRFASLRKQFGLTQEELAQEFCISRSSISLYESGKRAPNLDLVLQAADYFQVSVDYLLGRSDTPNPFPNLTLKISSDEALEIIWLVLKLYRHQNKRTNMRKENQKSG